MDRAGRREDHQPAPAAGPEQLAHLRGPSPAPLTPGSERTPCFLPAAASATPPRAHGRARLRHPPLRQQQVVPRLPPWRGLPSRPTPQAATERFLQPWPGEATGGRQDGEVRTGADADDLAPK